MLFYSLDKHSLLMTITLAVLVVAYCKMETRQKSIPATQNVELSDQVNRSTFDALPTIDE